MQHGNETLDSLTHSLQTIVRGKAGKGGVKGVTAAVLITHEFEL